MKCGVVQFIKGGMSTGERNLILSKFQATCEFHTMGEGFTWETQDKSRDTEMALSAWEKAKELIRDDRNKMILLDEINIALRYDYIDINDVVNFLINENSPVPKEMSLEDINHVKQAFKTAAQRADKAGFDIIEIHGAHGYLLHSFFSPISNQRSDQYGGSFENRIRFAREIIAEIKSVWPDRKPIFYRLSSIDAPDEGATLEDNVSLAKVLKQAGIDVIDCSSGGITGSPVLTKSKIIPGFQVPYSEKIKKEADISTMAVGAIIDGEQANNIIANNRADLVAMGRELLADTQWVYKAATQFNLENAKDYLPDSYSFYLSRRDEFLDRTAKPA